MVGYAVHPGKDPHTVCPPVGAPVKSENDEVAERCVAKLISVSETAHPAIRDQARAYKLHMEKVVAFYMREAIRSDRTTVYNALVDAGHPELAEAIRRL